MTAAERIAARYNLPAEFVYRYIAAMAPDGTTPRLIHKELMALIPNAIYAEKFMEEVEDAAQSSR